MLFDKLLLYAQEMQTDPIFSDSSSAKHMMLLGRAFVFFACSCKSLLHDIMDGSRKGASLQMLIDSESQISHVMISPKAYKVLAYPIFTLYFYLLIIT